MLNFNRIFLLKQGWRFYRSALTKYQIHSPFVFELVMAVLEDRRYYYAFQEVEQLRAGMLRQETWLPGNASVSPEQGRQLFRLANWANPACMLEIGASTGIGSTYLAWGARQARMIALEAHPEAAAVARLNLEWLGLDRQAAVRAGDLEESLPAALESLPSLDLVFFNGNSVHSALLSYFRLCAARAQARSVFVFSSLHQSPEMVAAWQEIKQDARISLSVDFFGLSLAFFNPEFEVKQHYSVVSSRRKFWKVF